MRAVSRNPLAIGLIGAAFAFTIYTLIGSPTGSFTVLYGAYSAALIGASLTLLFSRRS